MWNTENSIICCLNNTLSILKTGKAKRNISVKGSAMSTCAICQHLSVNPQESKCGAISTFFCFSILNQFQEHVSIPLVLRRYVQMDTFPLFFCFFLQVKKIWDKINIDSCPALMIWYNLACLGRKDIPRLSLLGLSDNENIYRWCNHH